MGSGSCARSYYLMSKETDKEVFSVKGKIIKCPKGNEFVAHSERYLADQLNRLKPDKELTVTFYEHKAIRSGQQLAYHWVLVSYVADHTGFTKDECHDAIMRIVFGTKAIKIGAYTTHVRKSLSDTGGLSKSDVVELISKDLQICGDLEIAVPTAESLGYVLEPR